LNNERNFYRKRRFTIMKKKSVKRIFSGVMVLAMGAALCVAEAAVQEILVC